MEISQEEANELLISLKDLVARILYDADAKSWWPVEMQQARKIIQELESADDSFDFSEDDEDPWFGDDMMGASG